jgi:hypothetical protein
MCVYCDLTSPRITQVDPGDEPLFEVVLSQLISEQTWGNTLLLKNHNYALSARIISPYKEVSIEKPEAAASPKTAAKCVSANQQTWWRTSQTPERSRADDWRKLRDEEPRSIDGEVQRIGGAKKTNPKLWLDHVMNSTCIHLSVKGPNISM